MEHFLRGVVPTLWDGNGGPQAAYLTSRELLKRAAPEAVQIHSWSAGRVADEIRETMSTQIIVGYGVDSIAREVAQGNWSENKARATFLDLASRASNCGAVAIVWNAEADWKSPPNSEQRARLVGAIRVALLSVGAAYPRIKQWHTAYDHPSYHSTYPWEAWLGEGTPIEASLPQVYAAGEGKVMAHRGALPAREARALDSWGAAVRAGWIDAASVAWMPYYQLHHVQASDSIAAMMKAPLSFGWALRSRSDEAGRDAFVAARAMQRQGFGDVMAYQRARGLKVDGIAGPVTIAQAKKDIGLIEGAGKRVA